MASATWCRGWTSLRPLHSWRSLRTCAPQTVCAFTQTWTRNMRVCLPMHTPHAPSLLSIHDMPVTFVQVNAHTTSPKAMTPMHWTCTCMHTHALIQMHTHWHERRARTHTCTIPAKPRHPVHGTHSQCLHAYPSTRSLSVHH